MKNYFHPMRILMFTAFAVFGVGCSEFNAPTASSPSDVPPESFQYPPIEDAVASVEAAGYRVISFAPQSALDDQECDTVTTSRFCRMSSNSNVNLSGVCKLTVPGAALPSDMTITIVAPSACLGVADFYPHPTQFLGDVEIEWDIRSLGYPDDFDFGSIVPLYVHDDGTVEEVSHFWRNGFDKLVVITNHFSRYIITQSFGG